MVQVNGRVGWTPKTNIIQNICRGMNISPDRSPVALKKLTGLVSSGIRHMPTGLIRSDKISELAGSIKDSPELKDFAREYSAESLRDLLVRMEVISKPVHEDTGISKEIEALKLLAKAEDEQSDALANTSIILYAGSLLRGAKTVSEVIEIVDLFQKYLPQAVSEFGVDFLGILINQAETAKINLERHLELSVKDQLNVMRGEKDLIHRFLHILTWTGMNRACYFGPTADGFMAIGSVTREEHENKIRDLPRNADPTELIEKPGEFNPHEDEPLNKMIRSLELPVFIPDFPLLFEKGSIYRVSEKGEKTELELREGTPEYSLAAAINEGIKFDGMEVESFLLVPVRNGSKLGFIYADNAFDKRPLEFAELIKRVNYTGPIIDAAQKREKEKNNQTISNLFWNWLKGRTKDGGKKAGAAILKAKLLDYRTLILKKEDARFMRKINLKRLIENSLRMLDTADKAQVEIKIDENVSEIIYQPYHMQGIIDGLVMNAIWSHEIRKDKDYKICFAIKREGNRLIIRQVNEGEKADVQNVHDWENLDLGSAIALESLDVKLADPNAKSISHGNLRIIDPSKGHGPGLEVTITDVKFLSD